LWVPSDEPVDDRWKDVLFNVLIVVFLFVAAFSISSRRLFRDYRILIKVLLISCLMSTLIGYYDYIHFFLKGTYWGTPEILRWNGQMISPYLIRMTGSYFDPNYFSIIPAIGLSATLAVIETRKWRVLLSMIFVIALILTFSRMAYLGLLIFFGVKAFYGLRSKWLKQLLILAIPIIILALIPFIVRKFMGMNAASINERTVILKESTKLFMANPIFGYGLGKRVHSDNFIEGTIPFRETHNTIAQVLLYGGIIYFVCILLPFFYYGYKVVVTSPSTDGAFLIRQFICNVAPFILLGLLFLSYLNIKYFWVLFFLILEYVYNYNLSKREKNLSSFG
jgi:O-antigen ligase